MQPGMHPVVPGMTGAIPTAGNPFPNPPMNMSMSMPMPMPVPEPAIDPEAPVIPPIPTSRHGRMGTPYVNPRQYDSPSSDDDLTDSLTPDARERLQPRLAPGQYGPYDPIRSRNRTPAPALRRTGHGHRRTESTPVYRNPHSSPYDDDELDEPPVIPPHPAGGQPFPQQPGFMPQEFGGMGAGMGMGMDSQHHHHRQHQHHDRYHERDPGPEPIRPRPFEPIQRSHNPLPPPPRDIFEQSPYARVLRKLRDPIDENAILGGAAAIHTVGAVNIGGLPSQHHHHHHNNSTNQGTRSSKEKKRKGLFRSLSHRLGAGSGSGSRRSEDEFEEQSPPGPTFVGGTSTAIYPIVQHMPDGSTQLIYNPPGMPAVPALAAAQQAQGPAVVPPPGVMPGYVPVATPAAGAVNPPPPVIPPGAHIPPGLGYGHGQGQGVPPGPAPTPIPVLHSPGPARMPTPQPGAGGAGAGAGAPRMPTPQPALPVIRISRESDYRDLLHSSPHRVHYQHRSYPTGMHLLEAMKFLPHRGDLAEQIRNCGTPEEAVAVAAGMREYWRRDWEAVALEMVRVFCLRLWAC